MDTISVIVPAHDNAGEILRALESVERAISSFRGRVPQYAGVPAEIVVVDDGSRDGTRRIASEFARGKEHVKIVGRAESGNPARSRNVGVSASRGDLLFFLDADDLFLEDHVYECYRMMEDGGVPFVKTGVALSDPVDPTWQPRIDNSVTINLCVRRHCHDFIGGFLDMHVTSWSEEGYIHEFDVFRGVEDVFYNKMLGLFFRKTIIPARTVMHIRYPGNSFDRQYAKFQVPPGRYKENLSRDQAYQLKLADLFFQRRADDLRGADR